MGGDKYFERSRQLRLHALRALEGGGRGHVGSTFSLIEIFQALYDGVVRVDASNHLDPGRDRVILSKGHGCIALYAILADKGFFPLDTLDTFCTFDSRLGGHPERGALPGVEASTGALGHGLALGVGMAKAIKIRNSDARVFVILGDGELNEGSVWESAISASHHELGNLTVIVDANGLQAYGRTSEVWRMDPLKPKWEAFGFNTQEVDGHDVGSLIKLLGSESPDSRPRAVIANTIKGKGISVAEGNPLWHHKARFTAEEIAEMRANLHA